MEVYCDLQNVSDDMPLSSYDYLYHIQDGNVRTPVTTAFFTESNLQQLNESIGQITGEMLNRKVKVIPNNDFFLYLEEVLRGAPNSIYVEKTVCNLNQLILEHEVPIQYRSLRRRELYFKWFFFKDRPRVISPPVDTHGRHRVDRLSNGDYGLTNPDKQWWGNFQQEQQRLKCERPSMPSLFSIFF